VVFPGGVRESSRQGNDDYPEPLPIRSNALDAL